MSAARVTPIPNPLKIRGIKKAPHIRDKRP
jgi:hypothetical protein